MMSDFMECDTCRSKSGTPPLCTGCLHNRATIAELKEQVDWYKVSIASDGGYLGSLKAELAQRNRAYGDLVKQLEDSSRQWARRDRAWEEAARALIAKKWIHHGTTCVPESDIAALAELIKE